MKRVECSKQLVSMNSTEGVNFTSTQDLDLDLSFESRMALATMLGKQNPASCSFSEIIFAALACRVLGMLRFYRMIQCWILPRTSGKHYIFIS